MSERERLERELAESTASELMADEMLANAMARGEPVDLETRHEESLAAAAEIEARRHEHNARDGRRQPSDRA